jgi:signal peptidase I
MLKIFVMNLFSLKKLTKKDDLEWSEDEEKNPETEPKENSLVEILRFSVIALLIVIPVRMFIAQPFIVSGPSMKETFHDSEYIIVDQVSYYLNSPERGDVIVFRYPKDPSTFFIKRIIGLPGDTIEIEGSDVKITNEIHPDGFTLNEPYIKSMSPRSTLNEKLGAREYFVMGDNRDQSSDSRDWGVLQEERIIGRAFLRLYPPQVFGVLPGATSESIMSSAE